MSDYITMQDRIAREVYFVTSASLSGKKTEIAQAIHSAIYFYHNDLFWFNEQQATSSTVAGFEYYTTPADYIQMFSLACLRSTDEWVTLEPLSFDELEQKATTTPGFPRYYCTFNQQLRLAPIPDAVYDLRLSYLKKLVELQLDTDTNEWVATSAEAMIRAKAKAILLIDASHDPETAQQQDNVALMWFYKLQKRTGQMVGTAQIRTQAY